MDENLKKALTERLEAVISPLLGEFEVKKIVILVDPSETTTYLVGLPEKQAELFRLANEYVETVLKGQFEKAEKRKAVEMVYRKNGVTVPWKRTSSGLLKKRFNILERDNFRCVYCGRGHESGVQLHIDHIDPKSAGGSDDEENLVTACIECNLGKFDAILRQREEFKAICLQGKNNVR